MLNKDQLTKPKTAEIPVGEGTVLIRALPAAFVLDLRGRTLGDQDYYKIIAASVLDENGAPMLTAEEAAGMDFVMVNQLAIGIMEFNALSIDAAAAAKEALKKTQADGSPTS